MSNVSVTNLNFCNNIKVIDDLSPVGIAERVANKHRGQLFKIKEAKKYAAWNGGHFEIVSSEDLKPLFRCVIEEMENSIPPNQVFKTKSGVVVSSKQVKAFAHKSNNMSTIKQAIAMFDTCSGVTAEASEFDVELFKINVKNGILDLETGELSPHDPALRSTRIAKVKYHPTAACPTFMSVLSDITNSDSELSEYLQVLSGYYFTGLTKEQKIYVFHGLGSNGKSTFLNLLLKIAGGYGIQTPASTLLKKSSNSNSYDLPRLRPAWLVVASETNPDAKFDEAGIKTMTGGEPIVGRLPFMNYESFQPQFKIALSVNILPQIQGNDFGIQRRIKVIPFLRRFENENLDMELPKKLDAEIDGVFTWIVEGARKYLKTGMPTCKLVDDATRRYLDDMNILGQFLSECCQFDLANKKFKTNVSLLHEGFKSWAKRNGIDAYGKKELTNRMKLQGYQQFKSNNSRCWRGIGMKYNLSTQ